MNEIIVVGISHEGREELIRNVIASYNGKPLKGIAKLQKDPDNPYDPNAMKILFKDKKGKWHHVGYVPREKTTEVADMKYIRLDVQERDGNYFVIPVDIVKATENNPFIRPGDGSTKTKVLNRIGCGLMVLILIMIFIIIFT